MITIRITYPHNPQARFDEAYFLEKHLTMGKEILGPQAVGPRVWRPVARSGETPTARIIAEFDFPDMAAKDAAFANPRMADLAADVANYSDVRGVMSVFELKG